MAKKKKKTFYLVGRNSRNGRFISVEKARKWGAFAYVQKVKIKRKKNRKILLHRDAKGTLRWTREK